MSGTLGNAGTQSAGNAQIAVTGSNLGTPLMNLLLCDEIQPGSGPSYQVCKEIYTSHPLGAKLADAPVKKAQSQRRDIAVPGAPDSAIKAFWDTWEAIGADDAIAALYSTSRTYGIATMALIEGDGKNSAEPLDWEKLAESEIGFSTFDPLNTSGSLVLNQQPNAPDFMKPDVVTVQGQVYHKSRTVIALNGRPIYIEYTGSAFGFVGRSVYQAALFPLKSFVQTMITDDMIARKNGLLVAKLKAAGSIVSGLMQVAAAIKRNLLKEAGSTNVINIGHEDSIETLDMQNVDGSGKFARDNILHNIAVASDMPAQWLNEETLAEGFGEGSEDARRAEQYVARMRTEMKPAYQFMDDICMRRAWTPEFYKSVQKLMPDEFGDMDFKTAFNEWRNAFAAEWPNLIEESDSEKSKTEKVKFDAIVQVVTVMGPQCDPENKATLFQWAADNLNEQKLLFPHPLQLDYEALATYEPPVAAPQTGEGEPRPDSVMELRNTRHRADAEWNEGDHPRATDGKFGSGGSSNGGGEATAKALASKASKIRFTPTEKTWLQMYSGDHFLKLNKDLRDGKDGGGFAKHLDSAISKSTLPSGTALYRGMSKKDASAVIGDVKLEIGAVISEKGFNSTTTSPSMAKNYASTTEHGAGVIFAIKTGEGQKGLDMGPFTDNKSEDEVLLPRDTKYKITGYKAPKKPGETYVFFLETVPVEESIADSWQSQEAA